jgi:hypothetical protein
VESEGKVTLEDVEPWLFRFVMGWLYTQILVLRSRENAIKEVLKMVISAQNGADTLPDGALRREAVKETNVVPCVCFKRVQELHMHQDAVKDRKKIKFAHLSTYH